MSKFLDSYKKNYKSQKLLEIMNFISAETIFFDCPERFQFEWIRRL